LRRRKKSTEKEKNKRREEEEKERKKEGVGYMFRDLVSFRKTLMRSTGRAQKVVGRAGTMKSEKEKRRKEDVII
jgi:hypothetical protein